MIHSVTFGFIDSVRSGMINAPKVVEEYEATTGCNPNYVVAGFSRCIGDNERREVPREYRTPRRRGDHR